MRAFIAVDLDAEIKERLQALVRDLRATRADVRWVEAGGMHLTVKFLGQIDDGRVGRIGEVLASVASRHRPFPLRLEGTGAFPNERGPRVLWVGCAADPGLAALQSEIDEALEAEGFEREARAFKPHLTLGRVKGPGRIDKAMAELARHKDDDFGAMTVAKVALFESLLRPQGAEYRVVAEAVLT
ncbi:MAG TPA: RNA 2',3'-cyclic phosphodiesterase [Candidatus Aminicenantes bacterium]|nr:RNA 2',3'-cyclic phosphodiesterase [Candidatus Aminicenantes bacterium]HRY65211.1 RNA 2',3'-cyclic phosphodiesterase [Candidatus Aminicenantes bacterium]HRZ72321.1 RNA 2',3'-cyclic phosphodiesterase [Candidatus Aminicenantes bacterium]